MKIAFILSFGVLSPSNGIVSQALTWKKGLEDLGHEVTLIDMWQKNDWKAFDIIHFYGFNIYMRDFINGLYNINPNIIVSPILDPNYSITRLKFYANFGIQKLNLTNPYHGLNTIKDKIKLFFVRSKFEQEYIEKGFNITEDKCVIVPLSYNITSKHESNLKTREAFCLHISLLMDERKNVKRLIEAAKKYNFKLVLGGKIHNDQDLKKLQSWIGDAKNIEYKGYLTTTELISLYSKAKVFALPSTNEGVGIVALEAAALGCDIVITKIGGPKEYYNKMAKIIDPYNIDEIGKAIVELLDNKKTYQPELSKYISNNFSINKISNDLVNAYSKLC